MLWAPAVQALSPKAGFTGFGAGQCWEAGSPKLWAPAVQVLSCEAGFSGFGAGQCWKAGSPMLWASAVQELSRKAGSSRSGAGDVRGELPEAEAVLVQAACGRAARY